MDDADAFFRADSSGFLMAHLEGKPAACISAVRYGKEYGFLGFYICRPELRGKGIGIQVWNAGLAQLEGRVIALDGVVGQQDNYRKSGFALAHNNIRFGGTPVVSPATDAGIREIEEKDVEALINYDSAFFPDDRSAFMANWLIAAPSRKVFLLEDDGKLQGFGVVRHCREGFKIGPLFAENADCARRLFCQLVTVANGSEVFLDVPASNPQALELATFFDMKQVFETARMYKGKAPELPIERTFGITTFELG
ncbi:MAG: GNAT family N-acetyltransferase [Hyphomicrobiales bacterium]